MPESIPNEPADARLDSGADIILLRESTVTSLNYEPYMSDPIDISFANGTLATTYSSVDVGFFNANVLPDHDLEEDLVSTNPFLDAGYRLTMDSTGGEFVHPETGERIRVKKVGPRWSVNLHDVAALRTGPLKAKIQRAVRFEDSTYALSAAMLASAGRSQRERVMRLHERMGHAGIDSMCKACRPGGAWTHTGLKSSVILRVMRKEPCIICWLAKRNKSPIPLASGDRRDDLQPGEILASDIVGRISPPTRKGHVYYFLFVDVKTGYKHVYTAKTKDAYIDALREVIAWYRRLGWNPKKFRTDSEAVLIEGTVRDYLQAESILPEHSAPYAHYQNLAERHVQSVTKGVSAMLHGQRYLKADHWNRALFHFIDCANHTPNANTKELSPHQILTGDSTNLSKTFQYAFGDLVSVSIPDALKKGKFDLRNDLGIYLGQPDQSVDSGIVFLPSTGEEVIRTGLSLVNIDEDSYEKYYNRRRELLDHLISPMKRIEEVLGDAEVDFEAVPSFSGADQFILSAPLAEGEEVPEPLLSKVRKKRVWERSDRVLRPRVNAKSAGTSAAAWEGAIGPVEERMIRLMSAYAVAAKSNKLTVTKALKSDESEGWIKAIRDEIFALIGTTLVAEIIDRNKPFHLIHATMQLKKKMKDHETVDKLKARCCACGNELLGLIQATFSPTVASLAHSVLHQIAVVDRMETCLMDTVAAYLNQDYPEDATPLYIILPSNVAQVCNLDPSVTYRVKRYIYGLPDAGRAYYLAYKEHLISKGYSPTISDPCLFVRFDGDIRTYVWFHVDDTFVASTHSSELIRLQDAMRERFEITVNNDVDNHLGVNMTYLDDGSVKLEQRKLLHQIFSEYPPEEIRKSKGVPTPLKPLVENNEGDNEENSEALEYMHLLGMLNYLSRSRPDICTALSFGATHSKAPTTSNFEALLDIVRYLWDTKEKSLIIRTNDTPNAPLTLTCHVDASYLTHPDSKSHSGYCMSFGKVGTFYVKSQKQALVATSSTHAEVRALYQLTIDIMYVVTLCDELNRPIELPAVVFEDNQPAIDLSESLNARVKKCKHFLMLVNYIREQVTSGLIEITKIPTEDNVADLLTKPLLGASFENKANHLLGLL